MKGLTAVFAGTLALGVSVAPSIEGQVFEVGRSVSRDSGARHSEFLGGGGLVYGKPTGTFANYVKQGFGLDGFGRWKVDRQGILSLGVDGGWLQYGRETIRVPFSTTVGRVLLDVTTSNNIFFAGVGPQLTAPSGPVRPYVSGSVGFSYFVTSSSVEGSDSQFSFAESKNFDDFVFATTGGAGVYIPLGSRREAALDIGVRYHNGGRAQYLREGDIIDRPGTTPILNPVTSETRLLSWRIGIVAGLR